MAADIRVWIVLFGLVRLYGITNPPLEVAHNWRQTTVTMAARNFLEVDANPLYPRVDFAGDKTGVTGMEFPVLNYAIYTVARVFGYQHWYGRLINLIISSFGLWFFFLLVRKYWFQRLAFNATIILAVSVWFAFSRKIMPDTFSMSLMLGAIYYGSNYVDRQSKLLNLFGYYLLCTLAVLAKLPSGFLLVVFIPILFQKGVANINRISFVFIGILAIAPAIWWYFKWVPHLVETYGFWHFFMGKSMAQGANELIEHLPLTISRFYETALRYSGFAMFLVGLFFMLKKNDKKLKLILGLSSMAFLVIMIKAGYTFSAHSYYIVPFTVVMALVVAFALDQFGKKWQIVLLLLISAEGIGNQVHDFRIKPNYAAIESLEAELDAISSQNELILINSGNYPTPMYFAHRKGWIADNEAIKKEGYLEDLQQLGLRYVVILKKCFGTEISLPQPVLIENENWTIYKLNDE